MNTFKLPKTVFVIAAYIIALAIPCAATSVKDAREKNNSTIDINHCDKDIYEKVNQITRNSPSNMIVDLRRSNTIRQDTHFIYTPINPPNSVYSEAKGINDFGVITGFYHVYNNPCALGFTCQNGDYTQISIAGAESVYPLGINNRGVIVGTLTFGDGTYHGFIIDNGKYTICDYHKEFNTVITGISNNDAIAGNAFKNNTYLKSFKSYIGDNQLKIIGSGYCVYGINNSADIAAHDSDTGLSTYSNGLIGNGYVIASHTAEISIDLSKYVAYNTKAYGINDNGVVVGTCGDPHGFRFDGTFLMFDVPGSFGTIGTQAYGINNNGWIVGAFQDRDACPTVAVIRGFLAVPYK